MLKDENLPKKDTVKLNGHDYWSEYEMCNNEMSMNRFYSGKCSVTKLYHRTCSNDKKYYINVQ